MIVEIFDTQKDFLLEHDQVEQLVKEVIQFNNVKVDEVGIHIISNKEMCHLHEVYFDDPSPTDCISFPLEFSEQQHPKNLGDVYICPEIALEFAKANQVSRCEEVSLSRSWALASLLAMIIDIEERVEEMRRLENQNMENLKTKKIDPQEGLVTPEILSALIFLFLIALAAINGMTKAIEFLPIEEQERLKPKGLIPHLDFAFLLVKTFLRFIIALILIVFLQQTSSSTWPLLYLLATIILFLFAEVFPILLSKNIPNKSFFSLIPTSFFWLTSSSSYLHSNWSSLVAP